MGWSSRIVGRAYVPAHRWLVRRTRAYQRLFDELAQLALSHAPAGGRGLLAPSSTGEILRCISPAASEWWCLDLAPDCLAACARLAPNLHTVLANLDDGWPLAPDLRFDVILCMHALHFLDRPEAFVQQVARALAPRGVAVWAVLRSPMFEPGGLGGLRRVSRERGLREAINFAPWTVADALMLRLSDKRLGSWTGEQFGCFLRDNGHRVLDLRESFNDRSLLAVTTAGAPA